MNRKPGRPKAPPRPSPISWRPETAEQAAAFKALGGGRWLRQVLDDKSTLSKGQEMKIELVIKQDSLGFDVDLQPDAEFLLLPDSVQDDILTEAQRALGNLMIRDLANP